ncbi:MAG: hypothetical protein IPL95_04055 [Saprospiraceae bacterium]|nr:hypothetical protein [Saprospiraceae bacterium]
MVKFLYYIIICLFFMNNLNAQSVSNDDQELKGIIYNHEGILTGIIHPYGWAVGYEKGRMKTYYKTKFWSIEFGEIRNNKEYKQRNEFNLPLVIGGSSSPKSFSYGKQNNFFITRLGFGEKRYLTDKATVKGVVIGYSWAAGPVLGFLKPYYIEQINRLTDPPTIIAIKYTGDNQSQFLDYASIYGSSSLLKGVGETKLLPGAFARLSVHFDWGAFDEFIKSIDAGVMLDVFPKKVPIMVNQENKPYFLNLYLNLQLGKRW